MATRSAASNGPFGSESLGGYSRIASADNGDWLSMLQPSHKGWGLHIGIYTDAMCQCQGGGYGHMHHNVFWRERNELWFIPSLVEWVSPIDPDTGLVRREIADAWPSLPGPHVGYRSNNADYHFNWTIANTVRADDDDLAIIEPDEVIDYGGEYLSGLVPVWSVVPIDDDLARQWLKLTTGLQGLGLELLDYCYCSLSELGHDNDDYNDPGIGKECQWDGESALCSCGLPIPPVAQFEKLLSTTPNLSQLLQPPLHEAFEYGKQRYQEGWQALWDYYNLTNTTQEEEDCFTSYWLSQSPYSPSHGPAEQIKKLSSYSTAWETQQAS